MANTEELKKRNIRSVLSCLGDGKAWNKADLVGATGLSTGALTQILQELQGTGEVLFSGTAPSTGGRRPKEFVLNPDYCHVAQLTITVLPEGYRICRKTCNLNGVVLGERTYDSATCTELDLVGAAKAACAEDVRIGIVCIANPGVSIAGKVVVSDAEGLAGADLAGAITGACGVTTVVENDVNAAAIGLWEDYRTESLALLYQPARYYVGVGMVIGGRLYNGASHSAGELRYLPFYTEEEQDAALATDPVDLLAKQLATLNCVMNPEVVGICVEQGAVTDLDAYLRYVPREFRPHAVALDDFDVKIKRGLAAIARDVLLNEREKKDEDRACGSVRERPGGRSRLL